MKEERFPDAFLNDCASWHSNPGSSTFDMLGDPKH